MKARPIAHGERSRASSATSSPPAARRCATRWRRSVSNERTYAIVITDGGDRNSASERRRRAPPHQQHAHARRRDLLGDRSTLPRPRREEHRRRGREGIARTVGRALHDAIADINSRYLAVYQSHGTPRGWRTIDVSRARNRGIEDPRPPAKATSPNEAAPHRACLCVASGNPAGAGDAHRLRFRDRADGASGGEARRTSPRNSPRTSTSAIFI